MLFRLKMHIPCLPYILLIYFEMFLFTEVYTYKSPNNYKVRLFPYYVRIGLLAENIMKDIIG